MDKQRHKTQLVDHVTAYTRENTQTAITGATTSTCTTADVDKNVRSLRCSHRQGPSTTLRQPQRETPESGGNRRRYEEALNRTTTRPAPPLEVKLKGLWNSQKPYILKFNKPYRSVSPEIWLVTTHEFKSPMVYTTGSLPEE